VGLILDTNALSAVVDGDPRVEAQFNAAPAIAIPVVVLGEYRFGVLQLKRREQHEAWLYEHLKLYDILSITEETAEFYADLRLELRRAGTPIPSNDLWIAALSRQHRLPVLSRDLHFDLVKGLRRVGW
jgi:tRNA(fMet)-specific endonuclease VapC